MAGIGPVSMITGSAPATANAWKRARGLRPSSLAFSSLMMSTAEAPSVICEELPAVITPSPFKTGLSPPSASTVVARMPRSSSTRPAVGLDLDRDDLVREAALPPGAAARSLAATARTRRARRGRAPHFSAISSAEMPWASRPRLAIAFGDGGRTARRTPWPIEAPSGIRVIDSTPPARRCRCAGEHGLRGEVDACWLEPHWRSMVVPGCSSGSRR